MFAAQAVIALQNAQLYSAAQREIAERKRTETALRESEERFRQIAEHFDQTLFVRSADGQKMVYVNPRYEDIWGRSRESLYANPDSFAELIHPDDLGYVHLAPPTKQYIEEGAANFEYRIVLPDHQIRWIRMRRFPIKNDDGAIIFRAGIAEDVTERKLAEEALQESEKKYRQLIETMRGGLSIYDADRRAIYVNDQFCEMIGYSREELIGAKADVFLEEANLRKVVTQLEHRKHGESASYEVVVSHKQGQPVYLLVAGTPLFGKNGEFMGSFSVTTDITAQKQAEEALRQALAKEKELGDLKSRFVTMASHEFRTPLATILAAADALTFYREKMDESQVNARLDKIRQQVIHLRDITEEVLQLARNQTNHMEFKPTRGDIDTLCRVIVEEFHSQAQHSGRIVYDCPHMPVVTRFDHRLMRQVICNLVGNALKYSPQEKPVYVGLTYDSIWVKLVVQDKGIGIPPDDLARMFEPFHRASNVGGISGTGLGLSISKQAIELHGGTIQIESQTGVGTTFTVSIPSLS
jgi:PAS domain S-box-containing protein